ncbi:HEPN domain-containing protein [bacterium]|nr:HEPN domain-containing protein [bacterium]MBU1753020.1 HEPN domain-containing protein [bacterium]
MSFDWRQYVQLAGELINCPDTSPIKEAYFRCAVSRAYYGMFCMLRDFWESQNGCIYETGSIHRFVINKYKESNKSDERKIGADIDRLRHSRIAADYKSDVRIDYNDAAKAYKKSKQLLKQLEELSCA